MSNIEKKREEFRKYLDQAGAIDNLTKALIRLYEQENKPSDAVKFLRKQMCETCPDEDQYEMLMADFERANKRICELERELSRLKGSIKKSPSEVDLSLTKGFDELTSDEAGNSLLKQVLTRQVLDELREIRTKFKGTFLDCIQSGLEIFDSPVGAFASDPDAYEVFAPLFDPLIEKIHGFKKEDKQPEMDWGEPCKLPELDGESIFFIQVECIRSLECLPFAAIMSMEQYAEVMTKLQSATKCMGGEFRGKLHALEGMDKDLKKSLIDEGLLFSENNSILKAAQATRFWPAERGIYINNEKSFWVWCNEEDHLRFFSRETGGNFRNAYDRLMTGVSQISKDMALLRHERLGFLTFSPENLGNTLQIAVRIKLPKLSQKEEKLCELTEKFAMKFSKAGSEHVDIYEVRSKKRLGVTEFETMKGFSEGIVEIIEADKSL